MVTYFKDTFFSIVENIFKQPEKSQKMNKNTLICLKYLALFIFVIKI